MTTYALGTIHLGVDPESRLPPVVWDKLDAARAFAMETDLSDPVLTKILECHNCSLQARPGRRLLEEARDRGHAAGRRAASSR